MIGSGAWNKIICSAMPERSYWRFRNLLWVTFLCSAKSSCKVKIRVSWRALFIKVEEEEKRRLSADIIFWLHLNKAILFTCLIFQSPTELHERGFWTLISQSSWHLAGILGGLIHSLAHENDILPQSQRQHWSRSITKLWGGENSANRALDRKNGGPKLNEPWLGGIAATM